MAGRPTYQPTPEARRQVETMAGFGIHQTEIARLLSIDAKTLRLHFRDELDTGMTQANMRVAQALYKNAVQNENVAAQIWWTKARMGWKEATDVNLGGQQNGNPILMHLAAAQTVSQQLLAALDEQRTINGHAEPASDQANGKTFDILTAPIPTE